MTRRDDGAVPNGQARSGVIVLGSLNMDLTVHAPDIPRPGETVLGGPVSRRPGGKGANQAAAVARMGGDVQLIGRLGQDPFAESIRSVLLDAGVGLTHVRTMNDTASGVAFVTVDARGENAIVVSPGANAELTPDEVELEAAVLARSRIAVAQLETPLDTVTRFAELCEQHGVEFVLNAAPYQPLPPELLCRCTYLVLNRDEAGALTGIDITDRSSAHEALAEAVRQGAANVVVTLGGDGCVALTDATYIELDAYDVPVVDTTGAGDAFVGAFAVALSQGSHVEDALRFAAAAGAATCTHRGAQNPMTSHEARTLLAQQPRVPRRTPAARPSPTILSTEA